MLLQQRSRACAGFAAPGEALIQASPSKRASRLLLRTLFAFSLSALPWHNPRFPFTSARRRMTPKPPVDPKLIEYLDAEADAYLESLPLSHFMEATTQANQRDNFVVIHTGVAPA